MSEADEYASGYADGQAEAYERGRADALAASQPPSGVQPQFDVDPPANCGPEVSRPKPPSGDALREAVEDVLRNGSLYHDAGAIHKRLRMALDIAALATPAPLDVEGVAEFAILQQAFERDPHTPHSILRRLHQMGYRIARAYANQEGGEPREENA
jgi:hypothetical protein